MPAVDRAFFEEHGWVIVRQGVAPERVALLERAFDRAFPPPAAQTDAIYHDYDTARYNDPFCDFIREDTGAFIAAALGCARVRLLEDSLMLKPPHRGGRVEWHQDYSYLNYIKGARAAALRLALAPCVVASGCMYVMDRSHRWGQVGPSQTLKESKVVSALPPERMTEPPVALELQPGDLSIHHALTFHGSFENTSDGARKTIIVHAFDADAEIDRAAIPPARAVQYPLDAMGRLVGPTFPLIYGRS